MPENATTVKIVDHRGIRDLWAAEVLTDTIEGMTFGPVRYLAGVATLSKTTEMSNSKKYYNNVPAIIINGAGGDVVSVDASAISEADQAWLMGETYDKDDDVLIEGEPVQKYFAIGYVTKKTDGTERFIWRLKGTFSYPGEEHNTEDDGTDSSGTSLEYAGVNSQCKFQKDGKTAKAVNVGAALYDEAKFFAAVQTPDTYTTAKKTGA